MTTTGPVLAAARWRTNADLIADVARIGYLRTTDVVLDATYGRGVFWRRFRPDRLICHDTRTDGVDFRKLPEPDHSVDVEVLDGPYKLNGRPSDPDERYGVDIPARWQDRHALICDGITEAARVVRRGGLLLVKCQDQVCSGAVRWQTRIFADHAETVGFDQVDRFDRVTTPRAQPERKRKDGAPSVQQHAARNLSSLLVLRLVRTAVQTDLFANQEA